MQSPTRFPTASATFADRHKAITAIYTLEDFGFDYELTAESEPNPFDSGPSRVYRVNVFLPIEDEQIELVPADPLASPCSAFDPSDSALWLCATCGWRETAHAHLSLTGDE